MINWLKPRFLGFLLWSAALGLSVKAAPDTQVTFKSPLLSDWSKAQISQKLETTTAVNLLKFSPDGKLLAGVNGNQISIWELDQRKVLRILPGHYGSDIDLTMAPTAIAFSPDSRFLASSSWSQGSLNPDQAIMVREVSSGEAVLSIQAAGGCRQVKFNHTGTILYGACEQGITAWSFPEGQQLFEFAREFPIEQIALSGDGQVMATVSANISEEAQGAQNKQIQIWQLDQSEPQLITSLAGHLNDIAQLEFTSKNRRLVSSSYDGEIKVWDWRLEKMLASSKGLSSLDGVFSISADAQLIAGNFYSSNLTELNSGLPLRNVDLVQFAATSKLMAFNPQRPLLAVVENASESEETSDQAIALWQPQGSSTTTLQEDYRALKLSEYWQAYTTSPLDENLAKPYAIGSDPQEIALTGLFGTEQLAETGKKDGIELNQQQTEDNLISITLTQHDLPEDSDDSIAAYRYLVKFAPYDVSSKKLWQVVWAGEQFRCWPGRGHQTWGTDLCH